MCFYLFENHKNPYLLFPSISPTTNQKCSFVLAMKEKYTTHSEQFQNLIEQS